MPRRPNSTTALGRTLEETVAATYGGRRSRSSGAAKGDKGDVRFTIQICGPECSDDECLGRFYDYTAECKTTEKASVSIKKEVWDKIVQEAREQGRRPTMFLRIYDHDTGKHIDLVVRDINDDAEMLVE